MEIITVEPAADGWWEAIYLIAFTVGLLIAACVAIGAIVNKDFRGTTGKTVGLMGVALMISALAFIALVPRPPSILDRTLDALERLPQLQDVSFVEGEYWATLPDGGRGQIVVVRVQGDTYVAIWDDLSESD